MLKLSIFFAATVFGYAFWWAADALGCGFMTAFFISGAGSLLGVWAAWKFHRRYHD
ncbi:MAG: hypothetical protein QM760_13040 [Nibricoccus sp.]